MVVDEVAHMLLHMVVDMVAGMVADMATNKKRKLIFLFLADMLLHMGADKVAGMVAVMADGMVADMMANNFFFLSWLKKNCWLTWSWTWWPTRR